MSSIASAFDMYRKVPADLLEGTRRGSFFSIVALLTMGTLFILETREFLKTTLITDLSLDKNRDKKLNVYFNMTMMDLKCDYLVIDVVSTLGTEQNITQSVSKLSIDADGVQQLYKGRNKKQRDVVLFDESITQTIEELHEEDEEMAVPLHPDDFETALKENHLVFIDFYASWCSHCRRLAPTWEVLARYMNEAYFMEDSAKNELREKHNELNQDSRYNSDQMPQEEEQDDDDDDLKPRIMDDDDDDVAYAPDDDDDPSNIDIHRFEDEEAHEEALGIKEPILIAKVDCVEYEAFCETQQIEAFPTLLLFKHGEKYNEYNGDRTVLALTHYLATIEHEFIELEGHLHDVSLYAKQQMNAPEHEWRKRKWIEPHWHDEDHPGCQISGMLRLNRVPGDFHVVARSSSQTLVPSMTNVSHEVHSMSFGDPAMLRYVERGDLAGPPDLVNSLIAMNGNAYVSQLHEAYHHHLKLVSTNVPFKRRRGEMTVYRTLLQSQLTHYDKDVVPVAKFSYDLSPVAVTYRESSRKWYDYMTSLMAIIGGSFTVVGLFESSVHAMTTRKKTL